ncbi:TPA: hypothetical protein HNN83_07960 [Escherichia coli]|nr:hypothetical protein [Escherichia coli]EGU95636.1 hypothetical protein HMPREF9349_04451 [Escherichia coli MS 79-10]RLY23650.1 hypothetical protein EAI40_05395 [Escherichia coli]HAJ6997759.1 hypothetical protein [Escherichia coli]
MPFCRVIFLPCAGTTTLLSIHLSFERYWFARLPPRCICVCVLRYGCFRAIFLLMICNWLVNTTLLFAVMKDARY